MGAFLGSFRLGMIDTRLFDPLCRSSRLAAIRFRFFCRREFAEFVDDQLGCQSALEHMVAAAAPDLPTELVEDDVGHRCVSFTTADPFDGLDPVGGFVMKPYARQIVWIVEERCGPVPFAKSAHLDVAQRLEDKRVFVSEVGEFDSRWSDGAPLDR